MRIDLTGKQFGDWKVVGPWFLKKGNTYWHCECKCGTAKPVSYANLVSGRTAGCSLHLSTHGKTNSPEYKSWDGMKQRCWNTNDGKYPDYGGRGITICERWHSFDAFFADMGPKPSGKHSIDRIDNDGPYSPDNCRWADQNTQSRNRRSSVRLTHDGLTLTIAEWAERAGVGYSTVRERLVRGWPLAAAISPNTSKKKPHVI